MTSGVITGTSVYPDQTLHAAGTAIGWLDGTVSVVGTDTELRSFADSHGLEPLEAEGGCVIPGLIDSHVHLSALGLEVEAADLSGAKSINHAIQLLSEHGESHDGELILARGLDEESLAEKRPPTARELDGHFPDRPVFINDRGLHYVVCNTACLEYLGLSSDLAATDRLGERASGEIRSALGARLPDEFRQGSLVNAAQSLADNGVTAVHAIEGGELFDDRDIPIMLREMDRMPVDVTLFWNTTAIDEVLDAGLKRLGGDILIDGSLGARTAHLRAPYADDPTTNGEALMSGSEVESLVKRAEDEGIQVSFHAIGDAAIMTALNALETVAGSELRHRIEHFGVVDDAAIAMAERIGVVISTQPSFPYLRGGPGSIYERRLGPTRSPNAYPLARLANSGLTIAAGSDAPVTPPRPLLGLEACLNHPYEEERIPLEEALEWFTTGGAFASHQEQVRGQLKTNMAADLVLLAEDISQARSDRIGDLTVELTVSKGRQVAGTRKRDAGPGSRYQEVGS